MFTNVAFDARKALSGVAAAVVVAFGVATLDQGHLVGAPKGTIEVGEPVLLADTTVAMLPEVTVTATRLTDTPAQVAMLPEVVVQASRLVEAAAPAVAMLPEVVVTGTREAMAVAANASSRPVSTRTAVLK